MIPEFNLNSNRTPLDIAIDNNQLELFSEKVSNIELEM